MEPKPHRGLPPLPPSAYPCGGDRRFRLGCPARPAPPRLLAAAGMPAPRFRPLPSLAGGKGRRRQTLRLPAQRLGRRAPGQSLGARGTSVGPWRAAALGGKAARAGAVAKSGERWTFSGFLRDGRSLPVAGGRPSRACRLPVIARRLKAGCSGRGSDSPAGSGPGDMPPRCAAIPCPVGRVRARVSRRASGKWAAMEPMGKRGQRRAAVATGAAGVFSQLRER
jgi:hypothetical protein